MSVMKDIIKVFTSLLVHKLIAYRRKDQADLTQKLMFQNLKKKKKNRKNKIRLKRWIASSYVPLSMTD